MTLFLGLLAVVSFVNADNQTVTYTANHGHSTVPSGTTLTMTSFFSPDNSIDVFTQLVQGATKTIDISTPGWDSWSGCTQYTYLQGCPVAFVRNNEEFPVFQALLNAIHRGVKVRIMTNDFGNECYPGMITPLDFLTLAGAQTTAFATLTFLHTKYMTVDGVNSIVSSVNYDYTSFMENREAGFLLQGAGAQPIIKFMTKMFELDLSIGYAWSTSSYNASDMAIINDRSAVPVVIPPPKSYSGAYVSKVTRVTDQVGTNGAGVLCNPDDAWATISTAISNAQTSVSVYIYQITDDIFTNLLVNAYNNGVTVKLLVSDRIYSNYDWKAAQTQYKALKANGITVRKCNSKIYEFEHEKFWIVDGTQLYLSSGNWGETDIPDGSNVFPPHTSSSWRRTNRDHTIFVDNAQIAAAYQKVLDEDYTRGFDY